MVSSLSAADTATLAQLHASVTKLNAELSEKSDIRMEVESEKDAVDSETVRHRMLHHQSNTLNGGPVCLEQPLTK